MSSKFDLSRTQSSSRSLRIEPPPLRGVGALPAPIVRGRRLRGRGRPTAGERQFGARLFPRRALALARAGRRLLRAGLLLRLLLRLPLRLPLRLLPRRVAGRRRRGGLLRPAKRRRGRRGRGRRVGRAGVATATARRAASSRAGGPAPPRRAAWHRRARACACARVAAVGAAIGAAVGAVPPAARSCRGSLERGLFAARSRRALELHLPRSHANSTMRRGASLAPPGPWRVRRDRRARPVRGVVDLAERGSGRGRTRRTVSGREVAANGGLSFIHPRTPSPSPPSATPAARRRRNRVPATGLALAVLVADHGRRRRAPAGTAATARGVVGAPACAARARRAEDAARAACARPSWPRGRRVVDVLGQPAHEQPHRRDMRER